MLTKHSGHIIILLVSTCTCMMYTKKMPECRHRGEYLKINKICSFQRTCPFHAMEFSSGMWKNIFSCVRWCMHVCWCVLPHTSIRWIYWTHTSNKPWQQITSNIHT